MQSNTEKVTLSLDKALLMEMAKKSDKSMSEFVRDLIEREKTLASENITISPEILSLKGCLNSSSQSTKQRVRKAAEKCLQDDDANEGIH